MRVVTVGERRARLAVRHRLAPPARATDVVAAGAAVVGLHATDPGTVVLSAVAWVRALDLADFDRALYVDRTLVRLLGMRRTMFVVPRDIAPIVQHASGLPLVPVERRRLVGFVEQGGLAEDGERWLRAAEKATVAALAKRGSATAAELGKDVPALRAQVMFGEGKKWGGMQCMSTRVLFLLAAQG